MRDEETHGILGKTQINRRQVMEKYIFVGHRHNIQIEVIYCKHCNWQIN